MSVFLQDGEGGRALIADRKRSGEGGGGGVPDKDADKGTTYR